MADLEAATIAEAVVSAEESPAPAKQTEAPDGEAAAVESSAADGGIPSIVSDHKRKLQDLEPNGDEEVPLKKQEVIGPAPDAAETPAPPVDADAAAAEASDVADAGPVRPDGEINGTGIHAAEMGAAAADETRSDSVQSMAQEAQEIAAVTPSINATTVVADVKVDAKPPPLDGLADASDADGGCEVQKSEPLPMGNGQHPPPENSAQPAPAENLEEPPTLIPTIGQQPPTLSRKIEVPNNKVGVLIGKSGDTIRFLQFNSGAKIQITRDHEADPHFSTRSVELIGTLENINKAEQLIRDVIVEADAGGSSSLVIRGFGTVQSGGEHIEIPVPNEKVGLIIGKGGETIKNLRTRSGARIQLIPQHLPTGDTSKDRIARITGNKKQIESAREMIKEVMNQAPLRPSALSGKYSQQGFHPRGPTTLPQWGPRATAPTQQTMGHNYPQRGTQYPSQATQYPQPYGGYSQQPPPRSNFRTGWDQRPAAPVQATPQTGGYDYYGQGAPAADIQSSNLMSTPAPALATPAPVNYNYGPSQAPGYGHPGPYTQSAPTQQNYGHGYNEPRYDNQAPSQQMYGQQPLSAQPGFYAQQSSNPQSGYSQQQPYGKEAYGAPAPEVPQSYEPPRASQPGDPMYQGQAPSSYGPSGPTQQPYPYGSSAPSQPTPAYGQTYGPTSGTVDGYTQPSSAVYPQHGGQAAPAPAPAPGYGQGGQAVAAYTQPGPQSGGYGQYPPSQPNYGDQSAPSNVNYGYQADVGYGNSVPSSGYSATPGQAGYVQQPPSGYYEQQSVPPQSGYGSMPGSVPVGYTKSLSPQPGYGGQYDSVQMYGQH